MTNSAPTPAAPVATADQIAVVRALVDRSTRITVLTGAGISTDSGIPDFRGPNGVWTKNPAAEKAAMLQHFLSDPEIRRNAWQTRINSPVWTTEPNAGHRALVELQLRDALAALVTQNVDGLHACSGIEPERIIEVHGTMHWTLCWTCRDRRPMADALARVRDGEADPDCLVCRAEGREGLLKSDTISFGQPLHPGVIERAMDTARRCDLLLAIGTSLQVYPVANMVPVAAKAGAPVVIVNGQETKLDNHATHVLRGEISEILPLIIGGSQIPTD